jgi:hypothetical protein
MERCSYCERLARELAEALNELSRSTPTESEETLAQMHLKNALTLLNLHETEHTKVVPTDSRIDQYQTA